MSEYNSISADFSTIKAQIDSYTTAYNNASDALNAALAAWNAVKQEPDPTTVPAEGTE